MLHQSVIQCLAYFYKFSFWHLSDLLTIQHLQFLLKLFDIFSIQLCFGQPWGPQILPTNLYFCFIISSLCPSFTVASHVFWTTSSQSSHNSQASSNLNPCPLCMLLFLYWFVWRNIGRWSDALGGGGLVSCWTKLEFGFPLRCCYYSV